MSSETDAVNMEDVYRFSGFRSSLLALIDEVFLMIVKQLAVVDVFHSLMDVTAWLRQLTFRPLHIRALDLTDTTIADFKCKRTPSIDGHLLS